MSHNRLLCQMIDKNIIQHGEFTLKSGKQSNIYVNLKNLVSYPQLLSALCVQLYNKYISEITEDVILCGVPYGALPLSTTLSMISNIPQIFLRKEPKEYGMNRLIEGDTICKHVIVIEDVVTTGTSVRETCELLQQNGYTIHSVISIVYRGDQNIMLHIGEHPFHYLFHSNEMKEANITRNISYGNIKQQQLLDSIQRKQTNIILAFDKSYAGSQHDLMDFIRTNHMHIVGVKIHNEILAMTYTDNFAFYRLCKQRDVFVWEDRKMNDIGNTICNQIKYYEHIRDYISIVPTGGSLSMPKDTNLGIFVLCEMSSKNNLFNPITTQSILSIVDDNSEHITGIICQSTDLFQLPIPTIMPGIHLKKGTDGAGQCWRDPTTLPFQPSLYVVGRAITQSDNPTNELILYKEKLFRKKV